MAITRLAQTGAELNLATAELSTVGHMITSSTKAKTGNYSFRISLAGNIPAGIAFPATAQFRAHMHLNHNGIGIGSSYAYIYRWMSGNTQVGAVIWETASGEIRLLVGSTIVASATAASLGLNSTDIWFGLGIDIKLAASGGWIYFYKDGELKLSFDGNTLGGTGKTSVDGLYFGGGLNSPWNNYAYFDDIVIDDTTGESAPAPVPDRRFALLIPNGNGDLSQFTGSDGDQVNNYQLVGEIPPNGDTDYVKANASGLKDLYQMTTTTPPAGFTFGALIALAYARKAAAEDTTTVIPIIKSGATEQEGSAQSLGTSYALRWNRFPTDPATGNPWTQSAVDGVQVGVKSGGTF